MLPHVGVHGRREHDRAGERQIKSGQEIVRQTVREACDQIGGGGRDHENVVILGDADVFHGAAENALA